MTGVQLALRFDPPPTLTLTRLAAVELRPAVFYFAQRERAAGRPYPVKLTDAQADLVEEYVS